MMQLIDNHHNIIQINNLSCFNCLVCVKSYNFATSF